MRSRPIPSCLLAAAAALASLLVPAPARAGGAVVPLTGTADPNALDVRIAVAPTPRGTTRWTEVITPAATHALWLVPARPGAAIDWAPDGWLAALDDATAVRIVPPSAVPSCPVPSSPERAAPWTRTATKRAPAAVVVHVSAEGLQSYAAEHGYEISPAIGARLAALYAGGWNFVSIELASTWSAASSGTLRVSDDGGAVLPLALTGSRAASTYVTAFTIGAGVAWLPGAHDVDARAIEWGEQGSTYAEWRRNVVEGSGGAAWVRESASHAAIFEGTAIPGALAAPSVAEAYFANDACASSAQVAGATNGTVGITCAPGTAARVPGGSACAPTLGTIDPSAVTCGKARDLAYALSGAAPSTTVITRWAGIVARGGLGGDLPITFEAAALERRPVVRAAAYQACVTPPADPPITPPSGSSSSSSSSGYDPGTSSGGVYVEPGCGGSTTSASTTYYEDEESDPPPDDTTSDSCSGGTSTTSSSSDGWDSDDSGDSCSGDDSTSSSSSDSCSGGSSSSSSSSGGSDDGWDTEDEASPQGTKVKPTAKKPHALRKTKKKPGSPVSRYALLGVALLLPLRRRGRAQT